MKKYTHDVIVVGAGAAGLSAASGLVQLGMKTALIEAEEMGGDCLYHGCIPSKSLIRSAHLARAIPLAPAYGLGNPGKMSPEPIAISERIGKIIQRIQPQDSPERFRSLGVDVRLSRASFKDPWTLELEDGSLLASRRIVLAVGSRTRVPDIPGLAEAGFLTSRELFRLESYPRRLAVIGAGPTGIELAQAMSRLACQVEVIEPQNLILPAADQELAGRLRSRLEAEGLVFHLGSSILAIEEGKKGTRILLDKGGEVECDSILLAAGRRANTGGLNLEAAGIRMENDFIWTDSALRSSRKHILAIGDCNGRGMSTQAASHEASIAVRRIALGLPAHVDHARLSSALYTEPELAWTGIGEQEARSRGWRVETFSFQKNDRALCESPYGEEDGVAKLLLDGSMRLRGVHILAEGASELISLAIVAVKERWKVQHFLGLSFPYPSKSEFYRQAAGAILGARLFNPRVRKTLRFLKGWMAAAE